jgi:hypothetical protein
MKLRTVDVPEDALPVYEWLGLSRAAADVSTDREDREESIQGRSLFRRLRLSSR